jgi:uncharacterized protein (TIGR03118 family)
MPRTLVALVPVALVACSGAAPVAQQQSPVTPDNGDHVIAFVEQHNLVSNLPDVADHQDTQLVNSWGLAFNPSGPAWVSDNGTGFATVYDAAGDLLLTVTVPPPAGAPGPAAPTGMVFNGVADDFEGDRFVFVTEDGTISGWQPTLGATLRVDHNASGAVYKGAAIAKDDREGRKLYVANFHDGVVEVYDRHYTRVPDSGFVDDTLPDGYAPFNIFAARRHLLVSYALQNDAKHDDVAGPGHGFIDEFDPDGRLIRRVASGGVLDSPWGMALVPDESDDNDRLEEALLVGNFGNGKVHAFRLEHHPRLIGAIGDNQTHQPLVIDGLWALVFSPDHKLFFTAGPNGEMDGLFGRLDFANEHEHEHEVEHDD